MARPPTADHITIVAHQVGPFGGMEAMIARLVEGLLAHDRRVTVISRACEVAPHEHLESIVVPAPSGPFPAVYTWFAAAAGALLPRRGRGIVHATGAIVPNAVDVTTIHFCHHAFAALGAPSRARRDTAMNRASAAASAMLSRAAERRVYQPRRVRATVAVSDGVRREVECWFPRLQGRVRTIPHGVDLPRFAPDPARRARVRDELGIGDGELVAIFVGGDWARKGLGHAIEAVAAADRWRLLVVGRGDEAPYAAMARRAGARDRVRFLGESADPAMQFAAADAFVLPTSYETFSLVTYEAAAAGLPLLVTPVSGPDQLIAHGISGAFLGDAPAYTASWLNRLEDADLRAAMGGAARRAVQPYTWDAAIDRHMELYDELAASAPARRPR